MPILCDCHSPVSELVHSLVKSAFTRAREAGRALSLPEAVVYALDEAPAR